MNTNYARIVCGGFLETRKLLVRELQEEIEKKKVTPERTDEIYRKFGYRGPTVWDILLDPSLLTANFVWGDHVAGFTLDGSWDDWRDGVVLSGDHVHPLIKKYLNETGGAVEKAVTEFQAETISIHVTFYPPDIGKHLEKMLNGEPVKQCGINSVTPFQWAEMHIYSSILRELDSPFAF